MDGNGKWRKIAYRCYTVLNESRAIAELIPHGENLCLIEKVVDWNSESIQCQSIALDDTSHPFCEGQRMATVILIEACAQAAAVHAQLVTGGIAAAGDQAHNPAFLGAIKDLIVRTAWLPERCSTVNLTAQCLHSDNSGGIYTVQGLYGDNLLLQARLILKKSS